MARTFKIDNYISVPGFAIVRLGLSGNELLCFSLIYGFTQDGESELAGNCGRRAYGFEIKKDFFRDAKKLLGECITPKLF